MIRRVVVIDESDNVGTATEDITKGTEVRMLIGEREMTVKARQDIPFGHKLAIYDIKQQAPVIKYGESIGRALADISAGAHVHVHNVESERGRGDLNKALS